MGLRGDGGNYAFAHRLREAREDADLTQVELAEILGVSKRTLQNWEAGRVPWPKHRRQIKAWLAEASDGEAA